MVYALLPCFLCWLFLRAPLMQLREAASAMTPTVTMTQCRIISTIHLCNHPIVLKLIQTENYRSDLEKISSPQMPLLRLPRNPQARFPAASSLPAADMAGLTALHLVVGRFNVALQRART